MSLRARFQAEHPEFPWLRADDPDGVEKLFRAHGWLLAAEHVSFVERAGEGNMNLTLRVGTNRRTLVLKQARPWVEKYDHIPAPWDRAVFEQRFYRRVAGIPGVGDRMPKVLAANDRDKVLLLEYLEGASDFTPLYAGDALAAGELESLAAYLRALHAATRGRPDPDFANREMRALNHAHIFEVPLAADNGLDLEAHEPGLTAAADALKRDAAYRGKVAELGRRYLADGPALLHGDYFPGSWLRTRAGIRVIDPEFCFCGDPEHDLGVCIAHLRLANRPRQESEQVLAAYREGDAPLDAALTAQYAAVEIMRRLIGVAQLPIARSNGFRSEALRQSRDALMLEEIALLWSG